MKIYFDTEFTDFMLSPALISIGFVADDGREFYAELNNTYDEQMCSDFVKENVLPVLSGEKFEMSIEELSVKLSVWIESFGQPVTLWADAPSFDWIWLVEIFNHNNSVWPINLVRKCRSTLESASNSYHEACEEYWWLNQKDGAVQHHALWDARSIKFAHLVDR